MNLNDIVQVKLTKYGLTILCSNHIELFKGQQYTPVYTPPKVDTDGWSEFQLWRLMQEFGKFMYNGNTRKCFVENEVRVASEN